MMTYGVCSEGVGLRMTPLGRSRNAKPVVKATKVAAHALVKQTRTLWRSEFGQTVFIDWLFRL